ncbi:MAG TPA: YdeI/OmpD-associated family protein [Bacteroidia bacterium]|nr:YdeI/OmpD-associated family protein [Bacteroidia bacterium]HMU19157.1 YdeI/OmpD-associated family protein [Bacteroidia bacterium]
MSTKIADGILHEVTDDIQKAIAASTDLVTKWNSLTPIQRNEWICWVTIVKKSETREEHIERLIEDLQAGKRQPCCWPGCPHRNPKSAKWFKTPTQ